MGPATLVTMCCLLAPGAPAPAETVLLEWTFDQDLGGWQPNGQLADIAFADGAVSFRPTSWDPFLTSASFDLPARPWQEIELRLRASGPGEGEIFWSGTLEGEHGGFSQEKSTRFVVKGTGEWETIRLRPFWHGEGRIVHMRFDLYEGATFSVDRIRIVEPAEAGNPVTESAWPNPAAARGWKLQDLTRLPGEALRLRVDHAQGRFQSPVLALEARPEHWLVLELTATGATQATIEWASSRHNGLQSLRFPLRADGLPHVYNLDLGAEPAWDGEILALALRPGNVAGAEVTVDSIAVREEPGGGPDLELAWFGPADAVFRAGSDCRLTAKFINHGAAPAAAVDWTLHLPEGVRLLRPADRPDAAVEFEVPYRLEMRVLSERPVDDWMTLDYQVPGGPTRSVRARLVITPSLELPPSEAVPAPRPAATDYLIGSYYFPGWGDPTRWEPIERVAPIRKPVLGWYDEAQPEIADWQIKWSLEHGVNFFLVDWYWSQGGRHLEHWLHQAFFQSRYHDQFQWAIMWANHNAPNTHSAEDWRAVTQYWIEHYLQRDDYLRIDGRPAVFIWAPSNIRRDVGGTVAAAELYAMSQRMAREAGLPGIYFVSMNASGRGAFAELKSEGYEACTSYHGWFGAPQVAEDPRYFPFSLVVDESPKGWASWRAEAQAGGLQYLPIADSGWDSRPWHGDSSLIIHDRTVEEWERLLREAKGYLDANNEKMLILGPWNEWGEGSYLEPCLEYGFGMLQAIRRVFCADPTPPLEVTPGDVGLGPYDFADVVAAPRTSWDFDDGTQGWGNMMGMADVGVRDGALHARITSDDPAFAGPLLTVLARAWKYLVVRIRATRPQPGAERLQVFWSTSNRSTSEASSSAAEYLANGEWQTLVLPLSEKLTWRGMIKGLRIDPCSTTGAEVWIDSIELTNEPPRAE